MNNQFSRVWAIPLMLAIITVFGLLAALLGTGFWHALSWISLLVPLAVIVRKWWS